MVLVCGFATSVTNSPGSATANTSGASQQKKPVPAEIFTRLCAVGTLRTLDPNASACAAVSEIEPTNGFDLGRPSILRAAGTAHQTLATSHTADSNATVAPRRFDSRKKIRPPQPMKYSAISSLQPRARNPAR